MDNATPTGRPPTADHPHDVGVLDRVRPGEGAAAESPTATSVAALLGRHFDLAMDHANGIGLAPSAPIWQRERALAIADEIARVCRLAGYPDPTGSRTRPADLGGAS